MCVIYMIIYSMYIIVFEHVSTYLRLRIQHPHSYLYIHVFYVYALDLAVCLV